jgi:hypothetical protein
MTSPVTQTYHSAVTERRLFYGVAEVADALGLNRQLVTVWRKRRSWGMPEPDDELASGPLWRGATIEPWIDATRSRLAAEAAGDAAPLGPDATRRWARRLLRLLALLLEDAPRPALVARALRELEQAIPALEQSAPGPDRDALLETAAALRAKPEDATTGQLLTTGLAGLEPAVRALGATGAVSRRTPPDTDGSR